MYYDTPRDYLEGVYDELLYGDQPLGWDIIGTKETVRAAKRDTFTRLPRPLVPRAPHGRGGRGRGGRRRRRAARRAPRRRARRRVRAARSGRVGSRTARSVKIHTKQSDQAHIRLGVHSYPLDHPDRYSLSVLATILGGGMSSRLFSEVRERRGLAYYIYGYNQALHRRRDAVRAGRRGHRADRRGGRRRSSRVRRGSARAGVRGRARQGEELLARAGSCSRSRIRAGRSCSACAARCSRGRSASRTRCSPAIDAVTVEDVLRVAQDIIREDRLNLAVIGPFDDAERFEKPLVALVKNFPGGRRSPPKTWDNLSDAPQAFSLARRAPAHGGGHVPVPLLRARGCGSVHARCRTPHRTRLEDVRRGVLLQRAVPARLSRGRSPRPRVSGGALVPRARRRAHAGVAVRDRARARVLPPPALRAARLDGDDLGGDADRPGVPARARAPASVRSRRIRAGQDASSLRHPHRDALAELRRPRRVPAVSRKPAFWFETATLRLALLSRSAAPRAPPLSFQSR